MELRARLVLLLVLLAPGPVIAANAPPQLVESWGQCCLLSPYGIAISQDGFAYVSDQYHHRVVKFTTSGQYVTAWGSSGSGAGQFGLTLGIALDGAGRVYVVDYDNNRVQVFTPDGTFLSMWGRAGTRDGEFRNPRRLVVDRTGLVHVTDNANHRIQTFTRDGELVSIWGLLEGSYPSAIAVSPSGNFYVAEEGPSRISVYDPSYNLIARFGSQGEGNGQFEGPTGIEVDLFGRVFVADHNNNRVQQFTESGGFVRAWGSPGSGDLQFNVPVDVKVDSDGNIYVVDLANNRIQVFRDPPVSANSMSWGGLKSLYR